MPPRLIMTDWTDIQTDLAAQGYVAAPDLAMAVHLSLALGRPLLLEGAAGVGKTEVARALAAMKDCELIRLQCYEGLDAAQAIYEWNYQRQLRGCFPKITCWNARFCAPFASRLPRSC
jgi:MoxR-like ATPase